MGGRLHADEVATDAALVRRLLAAQFPRWAALPVTPVPSGGTANAIYRLGDGLAVRLPRRPGRDGQVAKEARWLPLLAPLLPQPVPVPVARGAPGEGYPLAWSVVRWLDGDEAAPERVGDWAAFARDLGAFVAALRAADPAGGPPPGDHNFWRGVPLADRDEATRAAAAACGDLVDAAACVAAWEEALAAPPWAGPPAWAHGDLAPGNLLVRAGRLAGVIDFGGLAVGDPACDLLPAWNLLPASARDAFRAATGADEAAWRRGRGWALSVALVQLPYYRDASPAITRAARRVVAEVLGAG